MVKSMKLQMAQAAHCIGTSKQAVQKWLMKGQISLPAVRSEKGEWASFDAYHLVYLGTLVQFIKFGIGVKMANDLTQRVFKDLHLQADEGDLLGKVKGRWVYLKDKNGAWVVGIFTELAFDTPSTLVVDLHALFGDILKRASEVSSKAA